MLKNNRYWKKWCNLVDKRNERITYVNYEESWSYTTPFSILGFPTIILLFFNIICFAFEGTFMPFTLPLWGTTMILGVIWMIWHFNAYFPKKEGTIKE